MRTLSSLLCQPAPNAAEATKLRAMRTQACIPQFLHTNETSENLSNALHALFIHRLRLSTGPAETRGVRGLTCEAPAGGRQVKSPRRARSPRQSTPTTAPPARPIASGSVPLPPFRHFDPQARRGAQREGKLWPQLLPPGSAARQRSRGASVHVTRACACETVAGGRRRRSEARKALQRILKHQR